MWLTPGDDPHYFVDPAMGQIQYLGNSYAASREGLTNLRRDMGEATLANHAFVIFVTLDERPYAGQAVRGRFTDAGTFGSPYIHIDASQNIRAALGPFGQNSFVPALAAHEVLHLYGAAVEYSNDEGRGTPCTDCGGEFGCYGLPNGNCEACARDVRPCIMRESEPSRTLVRDGVKVCPYTQGQIGWADLFVEMETADEDGAESVDPVHLDIGERVFELRNRDYPDGAPIVLGTRPFASGVRWTATP